MQVSTLRDVAKLAGVSTATVSRALSSEGEHLVAEETRARVLAAAEQLGFEPSSLPANMRSNRSKVFGIVVGDIQNAFFTGLTRAAEAEAHDAGYRLVLVDTDEDPDKERAALKALAAERVAGVILASIGDTSASSLTPLRNIGVPVVAVDNELPDSDVDTIVTDNEAASFAITQELLRHGHRSVGMIAGPERASSIRERVAGFHRAVEAAGDQVERVMVVTSDLREDRAEQLTHELLDRDTPPSALYCVNNLSTMGALRAIRDRGVSIPDDIALVGFDDIPLRDVLNPRTTVVEQPLHDMGRAAARALLDRIADPALPTRRQVFASRVLVGDSAGPRTGPSPIQSDLEVVS